MPFEIFVPKRLRHDALAIIEIANEIIAEYEDQGFTLTLRQLYYQFVARDQFPDDRRWRLVGDNKWIRDLNGTPNATPNYKWLGSILNDARLAGLVDWAMMEDRTRKVHRPSTWESPQQIVSAVAEQYQEDVWAGQSHRPEVWIEKDALIGVIEPVCTEYRVPYFACRGNVSQSEQWRAGKRFANHIADGYAPIVLHLGDHDPSGIDMTRDNADRLSMFANEEVEVRRLALNMDQVRQYRPPPNPAKESDSRFAAYAVKYGKKSWELDALDPIVIHRLIANELTKLIDTDIWDDAMARERSGREILGRAAAQWDRVTKLLSPKLPTRARRKK